MSDDTPRSTPRPNRPPDKWRWPRRIIMAGALAAAIAFLAVSLEKSPESASHPAAVEDPAVVSRMPEPTAHVLRQSSVGVELLPGYDGELTINGIRIPEDQLDGVIPPDSPAYDPKLGLRPNTRNKVFFTPGPDKAINRYPTGEVTVTARFWSIADGPATARSISWAFFVN